MRNLKFSVSKLNTSTCCKQLLFTSARSPLDTLLLSAECPSLLCAKSSKLKNGEIKVREANLDTFSRWVCTSDDQCQNSCLAEVLNARAYMLFYEKIGSTHVVTSSQG